jgi:regulator of protease activity HflC (stomatin/prohibitin superfamily)
VSSYVTYQIIDPIKYILNARDKNIINNWLESKFRENISNHSYNELTNYNNDLYNSIIKHINDLDQTSFYGIEVVKTGILEINYSPEISEMMLIKQKAKATLEARKEIIDVTLNLIDDVSSKLDNKLLPEDKSKLVTYLTVSMIGNNSPSHVINMN